MKHKPIHLAILMMVLLCGCKEEITQPASTPGVAGKIEEWQSYGNDNLYLAIAMPYSTVILDSTPIGADGNFFLKTPLPNPPDSTLRMFVAYSDSSEYYCQRDGRSCSNTHTRFAPLSLLVYDNHHMSRFLYAGNTYATTDSGVHIGDYRVVYYYFSEPTAISGTYRLEYYDTLIIRQAGRSAFATEFSINAAAGWNAITTTLVSDNGETRSYRFATGDAVFKRWFAVWFISAPLLGAAGI
jgi:hypothetical protein